MYGTVGGSHRRPPQRRRAIQDPGKPTEQCGINPSASTQARRYAYALNAQTQVARETFPEAHRESTEVAEGRDASILVWRFRVLRAMAEVVAERGLRKATVAEVTRRASVSHHVFTELFGDFHGCMEALLDWTLERVCGLICEAAERESCWQDSVLAGLETALIFLDSEPALARACLLEAASSSQEDRKRRTQMFNRLTALLDRARVKLSLERQPPEITAEAVVMSVLGILRRRMVAGESPPFILLLGQLAEAVVAPYFGPAAAGEVASSAEQRAAALMRVRLGARVEIPAMLGHANARRLRACLVYLGEHPGASNKEIAAAVGISHLGQASTLLARLHSAKLLIKRSGGAGRPNSWSLSAYGVDVCRELSG